MNILTWFTIFGTSFLLFSNGVLFYHPFLVCSFLCCLIIVIWFLDVFAFLYISYVLGCVFLIKFLCYLSKKKRCIKCYGNRRDYYRCYTILLPHISTFIDVLLNQSSELLVGDKWTSRQQIDLIFSLCLFIGDVCTGWTSIPWWTSAP